MLSVLTMDTSKLTVRKMTTCEHVIPTTTPQAELFERHCTTRKTITLNAGEGHVPHPIHFF